MSCSVLDRAMVIIALALPMVPGSRKQQEESKEKDFIDPQEDTSWQTKAAVPLGLPLRAVDRWPI